MLALKLFSVLGSLMTTPPPCLINIYLSSAPWLCFAFTTGNRNM